MRHVIPCLFNDIDRNTSLDRNGSSFIFYKLRAGPVANPATNLTTTAVFPVA